MKKLYPILIWVTIFSIAMAFLETAVVIYLRELLYPDGFGFPLAPMPGRLVLTEVLREAATIIMLVGAGVMAGKVFTDRFAWFIYAFAIWDIFYYVFLKVLINWPESFLTWDILFLIPTTWTGPVISPVLVSLTMIMLAFVILHYRASPGSNKINKSEWGLLLSGSAILIIAFSWDYSSFILDHFTLSDLWTIPDSRILYETAQAYVPLKFNWPVFILGEIILVFTIFRYRKRLKNQKE